MVKRLSLVALFLCSVLAYMQDTLLHRDTAITPYTAKGIILSWEKDANTKYAFDDGSNKPKELPKLYPKYNSLPHPTSPQAERRFIHN